MRAMPASPASPASHAPRSHAQRAITPVMARVRRFAGLALVHGVLIAGAVFMLLPFVFMLVTSIKPPAEVFEATFRLWPRNFYGLQNYASALTLSLIHI